MVDVKVEKNKIRIKSKLTKSGDRYYINIPIKLIKFGNLDPDKEYLIIIHKNPQLEKPP